MTTNPYMHAVRVADKLIGDQMRTDLRRGKRMKKACDYLSSYHSFKLMGLGVSLGEETVMSGRVAKIANQRLLQEFQVEINKEIDAGVPWGSTKSVLKRWCVKTRNVPPPDADLIHNCPEGVLL